MTEDSHWRPDMPPHEKPPIGEVPNYEKLDQEWALHNAELEHSPLDRYPELAKVFETAGQSFNRMREAVGAEPMAADPTAVRLMDPGQWSQLIRGQSAGDPDAYYDPRTGNLYLRVEPSQYAASRVDQLQRAYTLAHELAHKATSGLSQYSFHLNEGMGDFLTQQAMENYGLGQAFMSADELASRQRYLAHTPTTVEGYPLTPKDIFMVDENHGFGYSRIPQLRLMETMQERLPPEQFGALLKGSFEGDTATVKRLVQQNFGAALAEALDDRQGRINVHTLSALITPPRPL